MVARANKQCAHVNTVLKIKRSQHWKK